MIGGNPLTVRPAWYDRSPINGGFTTSGISAPGGPTLATTYTVPAGFYAQLKAIELLQSRVTAASALGIAVVSLTLNNAGYNAGIIAMSMIHDNAIGAHDNVFLSSELLLMPDDVVRLYTYDASTGGTIYRIGSFQYNQFTI